MNLFIIITDIIKQDISELVNADGITPILLYKELTKYGTKGIL
jgi:hypothetical protein